jgi:hypothetical protein
MRKHLHRPAVPARAATVPRKPSPAERKAAFYSTLNVRRIVITPQARAVLDMLLGAEITEAHGIDINQICVRCPLSRNTIYPIISRLVSARWLSRQPETPQSRRGRAGPGKGGPPFMRYSLTDDGRTATMHELNELKP